MGPWPSNSYARFDVKKADSYSDNVNSVSPMGFNQIFDSRRRADEIVHVKDGLRSVDPARRHAKSRTPSAS